MKSLFEQELFITQAVVVADKDVELELVVEVAVDMVDAVSVLGVVEVEVVTVVLAAIVIILEVVNVVIIVVVTVVVVLDVVVDSSHGLTAAILHAYFKVLLQPTSSHIPF